MRWLEATLLIAGMAGVVTGMIPTSHRPCRPWLVFGAAGLAMAGQLIVEGYRWQMAPAYALVGAGLLLTAVRWPWRWLEVSAGGVGLIMLTASAILATLLPVPRLPAPTGPYPVGTVSMMLIDESRREIYGNDPAEPRRLMVQLWYPAAPVPGPSRPWVDAADVIAPAISEWIGMPGFFLDHVALARTDSLRDAPLAEGGRYPVVLFSHGWGGFRSQNTFQMQELASHGYVAAAIDHTYGAVATVFPDGQVALHNPLTLPLDAPEAEFELAANQLVTQWAGDLAHVLDQLEVLDMADPDGRLTGRLDLERVGALGHSTGGGAAIEFCGRDPRCGAVLTMDPFVISVSHDIVERGLDQPLMAMWSASWSHPHNTERFEQLRARLVGDVYCLTIAGTAHYDFSDLPALSPLAATLGLKGPLDGARVLLIINHHTLAFFGQVLNGEHASLLDGPSPAYPEVDWGE